MGLKIFLYNVWNTWRNTWKNLSGDKGSWCWQEGNGNKYWYNPNDNYFVWHRDDGPAIEYHNGKTEYWINGKRIPQLDDKRIYGKEKLQKFLILI